MIFGRLTRSLAIAVCILFVGCDTWQNDKQGVSAQVPNVITADIQTGGDNLDSPFYKLSLNIWHLTAEMKDFDGDEMKKNGGAYLLGEYTAYREDDDGQGLGLGLTHTVFSSDFRDTPDGTGLDNVEITGERVYQAQISDWLTIHPDIQCVTKPASEPGLDSTPRVGLRAEIVF